MFFYKVFVYAMAAIGAVSILCAIAVTIGKMIAYGNQAIPERTVPLKPKPMLTVVWRDTDVMFMAFTGTLEFVGDYHLRVTDERGFSEMVDRRDIVKVF